MTQKNVPQLTYEQTYFWTDLVIESLRQAARKIGFQEMLPALLSSAYEPGAKHSIAVMGNRRHPEIYSAHDQEGVAVAGHKSYYLPVSHVVEKQMALEHLKKV